MGCFRMIVDANELWFRMTLPKTKQVFVSKDKIKPQRRAHSILFAGDQIEGMTAAYLCVS